MSYILDALKRSEQERHQDKMPSFSAESMIIQTKQNKTHWWPYVLIVVLIVNAVGLFFYNRDTPFTADTSQSSYTENQETFNKQSVNTNKASNTVAGYQKRPPPENVVRDREYIKPIHKAVPTKVTDSTNDDRQSGRSDDHLYGLTVDDGLLIKPKSNASQSLKYTQSDVSEVENMPYSGSNEPLIQINPSSTAGAQKSYPDSTESQPAQALKPVSLKGDIVDNFANVPLLTSLDKSFQNSIPALAFNSHIYSEQASQRRVMINNFYLKEGQSFDGLELIEIGEAYIKVSKSNTTFKLPVLRDWGK